MVTPAVRDQGIMQRYLVEVGFAVFSRVFFLETVIRRKDR